MTVPDFTDTPCGELLSLDGRAAVVTGGGRGIGAAISRRLAESGAKVVVGDIDHEGAEATAGDLVRDFGEGQELAAWRVGEIGNGHTNQSIY